MRIFLALILVIDLVCIARWTLADNEPGTGKQITQVAQPPGKNGIDAALSYNTKEIHDIHGPLAVPNNALLTGSLLAAALLLFFLVALYFFWKRHRPAPAPAFSAGQTALFELNDIQSLMTANQAFSYIERIADILRQYIEKRFSIPCTRKTSLEFLHALRQSDTATVDALRPFSLELESCLELCDMAKFSHRRPLQDEMTRANQAVRFFIEKTDGNSSSTGVQ
jgi:hypothetical protein